MVGQTMKEEVHWYVFGQWQQGTGEWRGCGEGEGSHHDGDVT